MNKVCFFIHGIGFKNNSSDVESILKKSLKDTEIIVINWFELFDKLEMEFLTKYQLYMNKIRELSIFYACDVILYEYFKEQILKKIFDLISKYKSSEINIVSHSLGTIIISDFLYQNEKIKIKNFFTIGSPLALYSMRYGCEKFNKPISNVENWINIWNKTDCISYPLKLLNKSYDKVVSRDIDFDEKTLLGWILKIDHLIYFKGDKLMKLIEKNWVL